MFYLDLVLMYKNRGYVNNSSFYTRVELGLFRCHYYRIETLLSWCDVICSIGEYRIVEPNAEPACDGILWVLNSESLDSNILICAFLALFLCIKYCWRHFLANCRKDMHEQCLET